MIYSIKGEISAKLDGKIVLEAGGIGYEVSVPDNSPAYRRAEGEQTLLYTAMIVREDDVSLYGFSDKESLSLFRKLLTVSGVGAKAAMAVLSAMPFSELTRAIVFEDAAMLTRANGIGKKSAERIILELKDKVRVYVESGAAQALHPDANAPAGQGGPAAEATEALIGLGYSRSEATAAVLAVADGADGDALTTEGYIKQALKRM
ncbi:MAG: Holliday junction branch migration protein RuvA [Clostridiales Family XIII bacterium]|jgi:Holliday junction DNA helicase RuvA|nr:Holliday junction branch migration protein RuvA [Clostridiales Family XIII bacterium]